MSGAAPGDARRPRPRPQRPRGRAGCRARPAGSRWPTGRHRAGAPPPGAGEKTRLLLLAQPLHGRGRAHVERATRVEVEQSLVGVTESVGRTRPTAAVE